MPDPDALPRAIGHAELADMPEPASRFGPVASPVDRFAHLTEGTRRWLECLREDDIARLRVLAKFDDEDIADLKASIRFQRSATTIARFGKWLMVTIFGAFIGAVTLGEKVGLVWKWFVGGPR